MNHENGNREHGAFDARITNLEEAVREIDQKVDKLLDFRGWVLGGVTIVSIVVSAVVAWVTR